MTHGHVDTITISFLIECRLMSLILTKLKLARTNLKQGSCFQLQNLLILNDEGDVTLCVMPHMCTKEKLE